MNGSLISIADIDDRCQLPSSAGTRLVSAAASVVSAVPFVPPVEG